MKGGTGSMIVTSSAKTERIMPRSPALNLVMNAWIASTGLEAFMRMAFPSVRS
jgi:hypothetical protein